MIILDSVKKIYNKFKNPYFFRNHPKEGQQWCDNERLLFSKAKELPNFPKIYLDYKNNPIIYSYNKAGYRSNHYSIPNNEDYLMVFGCSQSWGSSLHQEHRYSDILEKTLNLNVINVAIPGGSANFILEHVINLTLSGYKFPKYAVLQWPHFNRYIFLGERGEYIANSHTSGDFFKVYKTLITKDENIFLYKYIQSYLFVNKILNDNKTTCFNFSFDINESKMLNCNFIPIIDIARDGQHAGINTHKTVAEHVLKNIHNDNFGK